MSTILNPEFENSFPAFIEGTNAITKEEFLKNPRKYPQLKHYVKDEEAVYGLKVDAKGEGVTVEPTKKGYSLKGLKPKLKEVAEESTEGAAEAATTETETPATKTKAKRGRKKKATEADTPEG